MVSGVQASPHLRQDRKVQSVAEEGVINAVPESLLASLQDK